jgi:hypothetical protein
MRTLHRFKTALGFAVLCAGLAAFPLAANAADAAPEITTAATHAGFASKSATINMVHAHMHHALNCIVGPGGNGFDATALNPCKNSGNGAIPDTTDAGKRTALEKIAAELRAGLKDNAVSSAQKTAAQAQSQLDTLK